MKKFKVFALGLSMLFLAACTTTGSLIKAGNDSVTLYNKTVSRLYCPDYDLREDPTCEGAKISWETASKLRSQIKAVELILDNATLLDLANDPKAFTEAEKASKALLLISDELRKAQQNGQR